ncbi:hypothetical protein IKW73_02015 [Candidatus Saccharibacteria bacterium]|nr:hypothetical protein [Candidatus Saccharibacteria bacterium]
MDNGSKVGGAAAGGRSTAKDSVTPEFRRPGGINGVPSSNAANAANGLKQGENAVVGAMPEDQAAKDNLAGAKEDEENVGGVNYTGSGKDDEDERKVVFVKKGPVASAIAFLIFAIGIVSMGSQLLQPVNLVQQLTAQFNTMQTFNATRSNGILRFQLNNKLMKNPIKNSFLGSDRFNITDKQKTKLASQGITLEGIEGTDTTVMRYTDNDGKVKWVVADEADVDTIRAKLGGDSADVVSFRNAFETDATFFAKYKSASMTWRGAIANWFESGTMRFLSENRLTRNLFKNFKDEVAEEGGDSEKAMNKLVAKGTDDLVEEGGKVKTYKTEYEEEDGKMTLKSATDTEIDSAKSTLSKLNIKSEADVETQLNKMASKYGIDTASGIAGWAQMGVNAWCTFAMFLGAVNMLIVADTQLTSIHDAMSTHEIESKMLAGDDGGELSTLMNKLNEVTTTTHKVFKNSKAVNLLDNVNEWIGEKVSELSFMDSMNQFVAQMDSMFTVEEEEETGSAMSSPAITAVLSGQKVDANKAGIKKFNPSSIYHTFLGAIGVGAVSFTSCMAAKVATNAASLALQGVKTVKCVGSLIAAPATFGISAVVGCAEIGVDLLGKVLLGVGITFLLGSLISIITPVVAQILMTDYSSVAGVDKGTITWMGSQNYLGNVSQANGNSLLTKEKYAVFRQTQQEVIAEDAKYERMTKSPFDTTSQYTFLGTLVRQLANFAGTNSIMSALTNSASTLSSSLIAMTPAATAYDTANQIYDNYDEICPELDAIGAVGSAVCIPYRGSDMSLINVDPSEYIDYMKSKGDFVTDANGNLVLTEDGNVIIADNSSLADTIKYGYNRTSGFGIADQSIANAVSSEIGTVSTESKAFNNVANSTIGAIPFVGDAIDVLNATNALVNIKYVTGEVMVPEGSDWENEGRYNQIFIEDQALFESMGIIGESAVTAYINKEREENPLDNSYEGILARYSGLEKEDVIAMLDILEYMDYIANYNPTERYAFGERIKPAGADELKFDNDQKVAYVVLLNTIEFADVRNRNFVV